MPIVIYSTITKEVTKSNEKSKGLYLNVKLAGSFDSDS